MPVLKLFLNTAVKMTVVLNLLQMNFRFLITDLEIDVLNFFLGLREKRSRLFFSLLQNCLDYFSML